MVATKALKGGVGTGHENIPRSDRKKGNIEVMFRGRYGSNLYGRHR